MVKNKTPQPGPEHSKEREYTAILEDIRSQFRNFGEGLADVQEKVSHIPSIIQRLEQIDERLHMMELGFSSLRRDLSIVKSDVLILKKSTEEFNKRLTVLETR